MALNSGNSEPAPAGNRKLSLSENEIFELIELLFFAYRDFISDPDEILLEFQFGRAHHRVLHFVNRNPGMRVTDLLDILKITKQSLGRVLRQLIDQGFVEQREGTSDRRQRLLYLTDAGQVLANRLAAPQLKRIAAAIGSYNEEGHAIARTFLYNLIDASERGKVEAILRPPQQDR